MTCPNCAHVYPISNGIPNMVSPPAYFTAPVQALTRYSPQLLAEHEIG